jgi:uncharacterized protein with ParB-like and HNH nuclease domain
MNDQLSLFNLLFIDNTEKEHIEFRYAITSYGADYPVDSIVKRIRNKTIFVPPFQRRFVWDINEASKFIESLILGLPVPGIFLSKEKETNNLLIVDGQQRLLTLYYFYINDFKGKEFKLYNVQQDLEDKRYEDLSPSDKNRLDDSIIHSTIIRQDEPDNDESSIYQIFERINSGGRPLSPQEIRACIYHGKYNELIGSLTNTIEWRNIIGSEHNERLKEEELILRFFSLLLDLDYYKKPMKDFLNKRMSANRNLELHNEATLKRLFSKSITFINETLGKDAFRMQRGIHTAIFDSVMVGISRRLSKGEIVDKSAFLNSYNDLLSNRKFDEYINTGTSDEASITNRIRLATKTFETLV